MQFPPYGFVPGHFPHPRRDPAGHSFGQDDARYGLPPGPGDWTCHGLWREVLELFNRGYYWEAHEGLEHWWKGSPPEDPRRPFFQGLLHLAAAGVKARQGLGAGVHSHATKAAARLREAAEGLEGDDPRLLGLRPRQIARAAEDIALKAYHFKAASPMPVVEAVLPIQLQLELEG